MIQSLVRAGKVADLVAVGTQGGSSRSAPVLRLPLSALDIVPSIGTHRPIDRRPERIKWIRATIDHLRYRYRAGDDNFIADA